MKKTSLNEGAVDMRLILRFVVIAWMSVLTACGSPTPELPTEVPTFTPVTPTETPPPTRTPIPTGTPTPTPPPTTASDPSQQAFVRFVHTAGDLGTVDFYVDDSKFLSFMEPGSFTDPNGLVAGQYRVSARPNSRTPSDIVLAETTLVLPGQASVLIVLSSSSGTATLSVIREDLTPLTGQQARVSLFNALSSSVSLNNSTTPLASDVAPSTHSEVTTIEAAALELNLREAGQIIFTSRYSLRPRQHVVFIPYLPAGGTQPRLLTVTSSIPGLAKLGIVNTIRDLVVDVVLDGETFALGLGNRQIVEPSDIAAREYRLEVFATEVDRAVVEPVLRTSTTLPPDELLYLILVGTPEAVRAVTYTVNTAPTLENTGRLVFINTLPQFPRVQARANVIVDAPVPYGAVVRDLTVPAGPLPLAWTQAQAGADAGATLENAPDLFVEAGTETLYLFTGESLSPPMTIVTQVGEEAAVVETPNVSPTPSMAPILYAVNVLEGLDIEFRVNDVPISAALRRRTASTPVLIPTEEVVLTALRPDTNQLLARQIATLKPNTLNVITLVQFSDLTYELNRFETAPVSSPNPTVRLLNLSEDNIPLGLAAVINNGSTFSFPEPNAAPDPETGVVNFRLSYPIGLTRLAREIGARSTSELIPLRFGANAYDIYVVDDLDGSISNIIPNVSMEAGRHYDVIAFKLPRSQEVVAYVLLLPQTGLTHETKKKL
jgi:hypothetical protein